MTANDSNRLLRVAMLQAASHGLDQEANLTKGLALCRAAKVQGADIALLPEMWNIGYTHVDRDDPAAAEHWISQAIDLRSDWLKAFRNLARELHIAIGVTFLQRWEGGPRNVMALIDRRGKVALVQAKVHTCDFMFERLLTPGGGFEVVTLDTDAGPVRVGCMICYDREQPESARLLMLAGAELILVPNACGLEACRLNQIQTRAFENMVHIAVTNYPAPHCNGHSVAHSGVIPGVGEVSTLLAEGGEGEEIVIADFDLEALRAHRAKEIWGNAYRRPEIYGPLLGREVAEEFRRGDARR